MSAAQREPEAGPSASEGTRLLAEWLRREGVSQAELTFLVGTRSSVVSRLVTGQRRPGLRLAVAIQRVTGIAVEAWHEMPRAVSPQVPPAPRSEARVSRKKVSE